MSAYLVRQLLVAARSAEMGFIRRESASEPAGFPATPGGRREDIDYSEAADPPSAVGRHDTLPRPALVQRDPTWILNEKRRPTTRVVAGTLFRLALILGLAFIVFGVLRLLLIDPAIVVDTTLPTRIAANSSIPFASAWASLHAAWTAAAPLPAIDPLSSAGAFVPVLDGLALVAISRLGVRAARPRMTAFKDLAPSARYLAGIRLTITGCVIALAAFTPWLVLLALPLVIVALLPPRQPRHW